MSDDRIQDGVFANRFRVEECLGSGGMGQVYRAWQIPMSRYVALKVLDRALVRDASAVRRFEREMQAAARVDHPNAVLVYEFGSSAEGDLYLAMELLKGRTLKRELHEDGPIEACRAGRIAEQICHALARAHVESIVHRDVKPENVMLVDTFGTPDFVKVLDFGIAQVLRREGDLEPGTLTHVGEVIGTPEYMSPEQILGQGVDHRSDLYSLGCLMYEMAAGHPPFEAEDAMSILYRHVNEEPPRLLRVAPDGVPPWYEAIVQGLLAKDPDRRPDSALVVADSLEQGPTSLEPAYSSTELLPRPDGTPLRIPKPAGLVERAGQRWGQVLAGAGMALLLLGIIGGALRSPGPDVPIVPADDHAPVMVLVAPESCGDATTCDLYRGIEVGFRRGRQGAKVLWLDFEADPEVQGRALVELATRHRAAWAVGCRPGAALWSATKELVDTEWIELCPADAVR